MAGRAPPPLGALLHRVDLGAQDHPGHLPGLLGLLRKPGPQRRDPGGGDRAGTGHDGALRALSHLAAPPCTELGGEGQSSGRFNHEGRLERQECQGQGPGPLRAKDGAAGKEPEGHQVGPLRNPLFGRAPPLVCSGWNQESEGVGSEIEAVGLYPEQPNIFKEVAEGTKAISDSAITGTKGGPPGKARSLGLKEIMNGSGSNFAKGLLIKPAIDWLRAQWSPKKHKAVEDMSGDKAESFRLPGRDLRADKRADLPVRYSKVKASMRSALITAKDPWRRKMAVNRLEKDFCANSSRKAKASRRHTIKKVFENAGFETMKIIWPSSAWQPASRREGTSRPTCTLRRPS